MDGHGGVRRRPLRARSGLCDGATGTGSVGAGGGGARFRRTKWTKPRPRCPGIVNLAPPSPTSSTHQPLRCVLLDSPLYRERVQGRLRQVLRGRPVVMCGRICGRDRRRRDQVRELRLHHARTGPAPAEHMLGAASRAGSKTSTCSAPTTVAFLINDVLVIVNLAAEPVALVHTCRASDHDSNTASQAPGWQKGVSD